ncbi:MAG: methyl-accepting chemotaxis protein [Mariprofundaceae bacterium]|nr:methyl-accepting chemotaxis protein [Mariprofundaceae bacterium]
MLKRFTINQKLFIPSLFLLMYFITLLWLQVTATTEHHALSSASQRMMTLDGKVDKATEYILQSIAISSLFQLQRNEESIHAYTLTAHKIDLIFEDIDTTLLNTEDQDLVQKAHLQWAATRDQFVNMMKTQKVLGLDENSGLLGELRQAVHAVEAILNNEQEIVLSHSMLMMRRHEKDFLARQKDQYVMEMAEERKRFESLLTASQLSTSDKKEIRKKMNIYHKAFLALVEGVKQVAKEAATNSQKSKEVIKGIHLMQIAIHDLLEENKQIQITNTAHNDRVFTIALSVMSVLLLSFFIILAWHLSRPLKRLITRMWELAEGGADLSLRLDEQGKDETATLAHLVNRLMDRLMHLIQQVQRAGIQVAGSMKQIAASAKEQEASTTEYAATANQVAASIREITITSRDLGHAVQETNQLVQQADDAAGRSQSRLTDMDSTMNTMASSSQAITHKLAVLSAKAGSIGSMVTIINKVADQTNLLSLNAAIEAEKAGEYGRGFAVVATEIRRLADQTAVATYDIEQMVKEVQSAVAGGVMSMDKFSEDIHRSVDEAAQASTEMAEVIHLVQAFAPHMESINEGLNMQNQEAEEISDAMVNLSEAAQQTADLVSQTNRAMIDLDEAVNSLEDSVGVFMVKKSR